MKNYFYNRQNKGITLIALVITIIVMLILVAVTISMAINGGLFEYAQNAGTQINEAVANEQILASGQVTIGGTTYNSIDDYINEGKTEKIDWEAILADANANPDKYLQQAAEVGQNIEENTAIGIGTNGKVVNMDLWKFEEPSMNSWQRNIPTGTGYSLSQSYISEGTYYSNGAGYVGIDFDNIIIPQYICEEEKFLPVIALDCTFLSLGLTKAPQMPETILFMGDTFTGCTELVEAPVIPEGVIDTSMSFCNCNSLEIAPEIPASVTDMSAMFQGCTSLKGIIKINSTNVSSFYNTFEFITNELKVQVLANSTTYDTLYEEYGDSENITIETFEIEE